MLVCMHRTWRSAHTSGWSAQHTSTINVGMDDQEYIAHQKRCVQHTFLSVLITLTHEVCYTHQKEVCRMVLCEHTNIGVLLPLYF